MRRLRAAGFHPAADRARWPAESCCLSRQLPISGWASQVLRGPQCRPLAPAKRLLPTLVAGRSHCQTCGSCSPASEPTRQITSPGQVRDSGLPWTTLRATQFRDAFLIMGRQMAKMPFVPVFAGVRFQPINAGEVAAGGRTRAWPARWSGTRNGRTARVRDGRVAPRVPQGPWQESADHADSAPRQAISDEVEDCGHRPSLMAWPSRNGERCRKLDRRELFRRASKIDGCGGS
jgi:hypothetical protein